MSSISEPEFSQQPVRKLVVIGLGLIGGSVSAGLRQRHACQEAIGIVRDQVTASLALERGVVDRAYLSLNEVAAELGEGDVIFIAVPTLAVESVLHDIRAQVSAAVTVTDGASVKGSVRDAVIAAFGEVPSNIVLGHPIAGSEQSGVAAANPSLYQKHRVILTPETSTGAQHIARVTAMWQALGAEVLSMSVSEHDEVLGATSHLPHAIAYSLVDTLAHDIGNPNIFRYAAGGFRDFTRIASSDPTMWHDIMRANRGAVLHSLDKFVDNLLRLRDGIEREDGEYLLGVFTRAKAARDHFTRMLAGSTLKDSIALSASKICVKPGAALQNHLRVPGDKSISHRAIMLGSIAQGKTVIDGLLESEDSLATLQAFRDMGVVIDGPANGHVTIYGVGLRGLSAPQKPLYLGNAGTSARLLSGILAAQTFSTTITGDASLSARPMGRIIEPLRAMGASIHSESDNLPLTFSSAKRFSAIDYPLPLASAQVKSCLLLAGLYANGITRVRQTQITRDHTERMLGGFGCPVRSGQDGWLAVTGGTELQGCRVDVPGDFSSAAFFIVAASITPGSDILLEHVGVNPSRTGALDILKLMGANIELLNLGTAGGEPVADIRVRYSELQGITIPTELVSRSIDEFPALFIAAACAQGCTELSGAAELRVKESDRLANMAAGLTALGVNVDIRADGLHITGSPLRGAEVDSAGDHRVAMALALAGLRTDGAVIVNNAECIASSFPDFVTQAKQLGISIEVIDS
ncbi:bifunctional prephenate dehydrogenase/3-phosphoshikimate 1-carboxyvinyltransferase [Gilvimarinus polysaccharolyticus]|uniref:bifunctional prephenate dehydrogenase/3-phosphoshikimate 1-carboxyvinyltransferase n=1 Tax=Gilvimarinus polysaccharolyticus TaxID=863921 RepID=UPI0006733A71|nr:bifunctional prephenate dehydrogenase/3-phosphoshikimate 1-carboxyvinyltransferase [Gilvimarinus polysaccharolyticus]